MLHVIVLHTTEMEDLIEAAKEGLECMHHERQADVTDYDHLKKVVECMGFAADNDELLVLPTDVSDVLFTAGSGKAEELVALFT